MGAKGKQGVSGNTLASQAEFDRQINSCGASVYRISGAITRGPLGDVVIRAIRFKAPDEVEGDWLMIASGLGPDGPVVAFHAAEDFQTVVQSGFTRLAQNKMKWRKDEFRQ